MRLKVFLSWQKDVVMNSFTIKYKEIEFCLFR